MVEMLQSRLANIEAWVFSKAEDDAVADEPRRDAFMPAYGTDEQVAVQANDMPGYVGANNTEGVIRSGDGSISKTRVAPGGGVAPYADLRVAPTALPWADERPPDIRPGGDGKIGNKAEDAGNDQEMAWEKHTHGCSNYATIPGDNTVIIVYVNGVPTPLYKPSKPAVLVYDKPGGVHWAEVDYAAQGAYRQGSDSDETDVMDGGWAMFRNP
jgi:hypothetical protein